MRTYALAIAAAALFALPTSAFSQGVELGPGGVRIEPSYHGYYHGRSAYGGNVGNCGCVHPQGRTGRARSRQLRAVSPKVRAGLASLRPRRRLSFLAAKMELFELKGDLPHSPGGLQLLGEAPGGRRREEASTIQAIRASG